MSENWVCPKCQAYNHPKRRECWQCQRAETQAVAAHAGGKVSSRFKLVLSIGVAVVGIVLIALCLTKLTSLLLVPSLAFTPAFTPTPAPTPSPSQIVSLEALDSYRVEMRMNISNTLIPEVTWLVTEEWNKESQAFHTIMSMEIPEGTPEPDAEGSPWSGMTESFGTPRVEVIGIGDVYWVNRMGEWVKIQGTALQSSQDGMSADAIYEYVKALHNLQPVGEETVNNIRCVRYLADEDMLQMSTTSQGNIKMHTAGDIWVAYQPDLPPVVIKLHITQTIHFDSPTPIPDVTQDPQQVIMGMFQTDESSNMYEYNVVGINIPISITPPLTGTLSP